MTATLALRASADLVSADLVSADLASADLLSTDLLSADLVSADLLSTAAFTVHSPRPRGLERAAITLGVAMLRWARARAERGMMTREEHSRTFATVCDVELRQHRTLSLAMRVS
ncbi:hypothetical protein [Lacisediminihabitans profunda]|uniref:Pentapeptide repeat-containing protein n=1 Tax=Lacisediminihabitans profunda TaxID=2594790 RepID=A0A5C8UT25_9MICO|nr:hypothetical protein [Lacisediminihabitans profunda]TXN31407.1 hypothetical protein FVP33_07610 [Lacisediminihabitans profunda]